MNSILKICRVGPLLGLITRWHLYRVSRHADAASRSVLPRERFRSLARLRHAEAVDDVRFLVKIERIRHSVGTTRMTHKRHSGPLNSCNSLAFKPAVAGM